MIAAVLALVLAADGGVTATPHFSIGPAPKAEVRRVVTLAPSLTDLVIALGAGDRLVGVSRFDTLPQVAKLPRVGGFVDPSVEAVVALQPDLVIVQPGPGNERPVRKMAELGISVLALPMQDLAGVAGAMREAGRVLGRAKQGTALAEELERTRADVRARAQKLPRRKVLLVYGFQPFVVAGPGSFADELLADAGAINAARSARTAYPVYSAESAIRDAPDVVIDAVMGHEGKGENLRALPGLREARWVTVPSEDLLHPGPNITRGLVTLQRMIYPELVPDAGTAPRR